MATSGAGMAQADPAAGNRTLFVEARRYARQPLEAMVRVGWINDDKRMEYLAAKGIDGSGYGIAVLAEQRLRLSALVHVEIGESRQAAVGRVRNCISAEGGWRIGIELTPLG